MIWYLIVLLDFLVHEFRILKMKHAFYLSYSFIKSQLLMFYFVVPHMNPLSLFVHILALLLSVNDTYLHEYIHM